MRRVQGVYEEEIQIQESGNSFDDDSESSEDFGRMMENF